MGLAKLLGCGVNAAGHDDYHVFSFKLAPLLRSLFMSFYFILLTVLISMVVFVTALVMFF